MLALDLKSPVTKNKHPSDGTIKERRVSLSYCGEICASLQPSSVKELSKWFFSELLTSLSLGLCVLKLTSGGIWSPHHPRGQNKQDTTT